MRTSPDLILSHNFLLPFMYVLEFPDYVVVVVVVARSNVLRLEGGWPRMRAALMTRAVRAIMVVGD